MKLLSLYKYFLFIFILFAITSCDREYETDIISETPPALEVVVTNHLNEKLQGASVSMYKSEDAWNNETSPVTSKQTDASGSVVFTLNELKEPGFVYLITSDGTKKVKTKTKYLLLTDGVTRINISLL